MKPESPKDICCRFPWGGVCAGLLASALFVIAFLFGIGWRPFCKLVTGKLSGIEKVKITYYGTKPYPNADEIVLLTPERDNDLISSLYKEISSTRMWAASETEETLNTGPSDEPLPFFLIKFSYKNGEGDTIESGESGKKIVMHTSSCLDYYEGSGEKVSPIIKEALERNKR